jgi:hypothetical protein
MADSMQSGLLRTLLRMVRQRLDTFDLDYDAAWQSDWYERPFTQDEIAAHPDGARIRSTVEAVAAHLVQRAVADLQRDLGTEV